MPKLEGEKLIAFLKAMEFTTITRRVGEICGVDANAIEPDPPSSAPAAGAAATARPQSARRPRPRARDAAQGRKPPPSPTPQALAADARGERAATQKIDVSAYKTVTTLEELDALDRPRA